MEYQLRKSRRSKYLRLIVNQEGRLVVSAPVHASERAISRFIEEHRSWIETNLAKTKIKQQTRPMIAIGSKFQFIDQTLTIMVTEHFPLDNSRISGNSWLLMPNETISKQSIEKSLQQWLTQQAKKYLPDRLKSLNDEYYHHKYQKVILRSQKSRWGSCSTSGTISLNTRLMLVPQAVSDYVLIHELAHVKVHNHSSTFWQLVAFADPQYKAHRKWLKDKGQSLII